MTSFLFFINYINLDMICGFYQILKSMNKKLLLIFCFFFLFVWLFYYCLSLFLLSTFFSFGLTHFFLSLSFFFVFIFSFYLTLFLCVCLSRGNEKKILLQSEIDPRSEYKYIVHKLESWLCNWTLVSPLLVLKSQNWRWTFI